MNKKVLFTLSLGVMSLVLLILSSVFDSFEFLAMVFAVSGSMAGIWNLISLLFKSLVLDNREKLYLFGGTLVSLIAFGLGEYNFFLLYWFPMVVVSVFFLKLRLSVLTKIVSTMTSSLQDKITKIEEEKKQRESNQPSDIQR